MMQQDSKKPRVKREPILPVFQYAALISTRLIHSETALLEGVTLFDFRDAVSIKLFYLPNDWPGRGLLTQEDVAAAALLKILRTFALREPVKIESRQQMEETLHKNFGDVTGIQDDGTYKQFECTVQLLRDGNVTWSYVHRSTGKYFSNISLDTSGNDLRLDDYLLAQMKSDLYRRLEG